MIEMDWQQKAEAAVRIDMRLFWSGYFCGRCGQISVGSYWCINPACR